MKRIEVIVSPTGETQIETYGFEGQSCRAATNKLEAALGKTRADSLKPEYYENQTNTIQQKEKE